MDIYTLYKTTNLENGKYYIGVRKETAYPEVDSYLGSGVAINRAIKKYGRKNFKREFLAVFQCSEDAFEAERMYVTESFIAESENYNIGVGGKGGNLYTNRHYSEEWRVEAGKRVSLGITGMLGMKHSDESRDRMRRSALGKVLSEETKKKMSESRTGIVKDGNWRRELSKSHSGGKCAMVDGVEYDSQRHAAEVLNIPKSTINQRFKSDNFPNYCMVSKSHA